MKTPRWNRIGAFVIDITTANAFSSLIMIFIGKYFIIETNSLISDLMTVIALLILSIIFMVTYNVVCHKLIGGTFGKLVLRVKIINTFIIPPLYKTQVFGNIVNTKTMIKREYIKWCLFYGTLGLYGLYCFYKIMKKELLYHEIKSETKIRSYDE